MDSVSSARLPDAIADPPQHQTADWSREKSQREGRECAELLGSRIGGREELMADLAGEIAVNGEVKPLQDVSNQAGERGANGGLVRA